MSYTAKTITLSSLLFSVGTLLLFACVLLFIQPVSAQEKQPPTDILQQKDLPPASGKSKPRSMPVKGEDGLYHHSWFKDSFLDLREDIAEAKAEGKQVVLFVEMNGCPYCKKLQQNVMSSFYIKNYVQKNFHAIQLNIYGDRSATDLDGKEMTESQLLKRWGVRVTPTMIFLPETAPKDTKKSGRELAVIPPVLPASLSAEALYDLFVWVKHKGYLGKTDFRAFYTERQALRNGME